MSGLASPASLACSCGATPDPSESPGTGQYVENDAVRFICMRCWQIECGMAKGAIEVVEQPSFTFEGPPMRGTCSACGTDLDEQRRLGKVGHACFGPNDITNYDPPS